MGGGQESYQRLSQDSYQPYLVAVNLTRRCNLACAHCYMDAEQRGSAGAGELDGGELEALFREIGGRAPGAIIVLTGGEPLLRPDIISLVASGCRAGLRMVLGTNGVLLTRRLAERLVKAGLSGVGISLDGLEPGAHDEFRGLPGAFARSCEAVRICSGMGLHAQIHFTLTPQTVGREGEVVALARDLGAPLVNFFFLICVGRGHSGLDLSPEEYESALERIARLQREQKGILIQSRCTPHFKRVLYAENPESEFTRARGYDGGGCPAGTHYARITPGGDMTPCPYMELSGGNVRRQGFWDIWDNARLFKSFRDPELLQGRCGACEYKLLCGGCRARALAKSGNLMGEDPSCAYVPGGGPVIPARLEAGERAVEWTAEARERLSRVPLFLRPLVRRGLEERARREGLPVTAELMRRHREERQAELGLRFADTEAPPFARALARRFAQGLEEPSARGIAATGYDKGG